MLRVGYILTLALFSHLPVHKCVGLNDVQCPDPATKCPDKTTCCQLVTKQWGCCPIDHAVCCSDGLHCCPPKTTCNLQTMTCDNATIGGSWTPFWDIQRSSIPKNTEGILCPDGKKTCPPSNTCCKYGNPPDWSCCQFPHAVCCTDHIHCCPHGSVCNGSKCVMSGGGKLFTTAVKITEQRLSGITTRCSASAFCDDQSTCCETSPGEWGCCPFTNAVCCSDNVHCCPSGTTCDASSGYCRYRYGTGGRKWMKKYGAISAYTVVCPGGEYECPVDNICCEMAGGQFGCCMTNGVCCSDKAHCCPPGTTCKSDGTCGPTGIRQSDIRPASRVTDIQCPDHSKCPAGSTCCPISDTRYGCCPLSHAVCCSDRLHCCPTGTTCDPEEQRCKNARGTAVPWFTKFKPKSG